MKTLCSLSILLVFISCSGQTSGNDEKLNFPVQKSEAEWRKELREETFFVMRKKGTERAFSGEYDRYKGSGTFLCAACAHPLFSGTHKFDSGTGWPSFYKALNEQSVVEISDRSGGMMRTEVVCANCGGHLGHVFNDGPRPTGMRYCMNSAALKLEKK